MSGCRQVAVVAAGSVAIRETGACEAMLDASGMVPGQSRRGTVVVESTGEPSPLRLACTGLTGHSLADRLELEVHEVTNGRQLLWSGPVRELGSVELGVFAPGELRTYRLVVTWRAAGDASHFEGLASFVFLRWERSPGPVAVAEAAHALDAVGGGAQLPAQVADV